MSPEKRCPHEDEAGGDVLASAARVLRRKNEAYATKDGAERIARSFLLVSAGQMARCIADLVESPETPGLDDGARALVERLRSNEEDPEPALGLAECAARLGRTDDACLFARESLRRGSKHPRALCIIGVCELRRGERTAAQQHLAAATRLARSKTEYRRELRIAQRLLFILHFGSGRRSPAVRLVNEGSEA